VEVWPHRAQVRADRPAVHRSSSFGRPTGAAEFIGPDATLALVLKPIEGLPDGVIGFEADGEIRSSDYTDVLQPAVREVEDRGGDVRIVLVFERWDGMSSGAVWRDLKMGVDNLRRWKRIALVTDLDWMITVISLFGWMTPGELKRFPIAERGQAIA
jgi:hypothetical protein